MQPPDIDRVPFFFALFCCLVVAGAIFVAACNPARVASTAVIDCTRADNAAKIAIVEAELAALTGWSERYAHATAAGIVIGGCALVRIVTATPEKPPAASVLPATPDIGRATLERFRREQAGGAMFRTAGGLR